MRKRAPSNDIDGARSYIYQYISRLYSLPPPCLTMQKV